MEKEIQKEMREKDGKVRSCGGDEVFSSSDVTKTTTFHYIADGNDLSVDLVIRSPRDGEYVSG